MWVRKSVYLETCPRSYVTAASLGWLESFAMWKALGGHFTDLSARTADAFSVLEKELRAETGHVTE